MTMAGNFDSDVSISISSDEIAYSKANKSHAAILMACTDARPKEVSVGQFVAGNSVFHRAYVSANRLSSARCSPVAAASSRSAHAQTRSMISRPLGELPTEVTVPKPASP
jgi:hypothetical protein